ncbi:MAG: 5'/3'-nucleotidase SurE [Tindallia sp. MSAO_Bac2]|nr:MAG: 5'/3'-nucleotidase SurE [Tindallia sp. MSAO_Bac2]
MHILITNDDGIYAPGIKSLINALKQIGRITVAAPDKERSATGHAITMHSPIMAKSIDKYGEEIKAHAVSGTPADCVKLALDMFIKDDWPDIVVSGINNGPNLGTDVIYSGTVSGAIEASMMGVPSIAISMSDHRFISFEDAAAFTSKMVCKVFECSITSSPIFNINYPVCKPGEVKGAKITKLGIRKYRNNFIHREDPRGNRYYWMAGELEDLPQDDNSDIVAINNNYISITPLQFDLTHYKVMESIKGWESTFDLK